MDFYQNDINDNVTHKSTNHESSLYKVNLLVAKKSFEISKMTSDPKRAHETIKSHMGIQNYHQSMLGNIWFMRTMINRDIFPHEVHILARKEVHGYRWRNKCPYDNTIRRQCRAIIETRTIMTKEAIRKLYSDNKRSLRLLHKMLDTIKL